MTDARFPRIVGFDLPANIGSVPDPDAPIIALLDIAPASGWMEVFEREAAVLPDGQRLAQVTLDGDRIFCLGPALDPKVLMPALRVLVERTTQIRTSERWAEAQAPAGAFDRSA
jgi:hypothetical protein